MAIEDGKDVRNFLKHPDEHMAIKEARRMLRYQIRVFDRAIKHEQKMYDELIEGTERRKQSYKPTFDSLEKLNEAYVIGKVDDKEYMRNRSAIWNVYSDRGHIANLEWLHKERDKYQKRLDHIDDWIDEQRRVSNHERYKRKYKKVHNRNNMRRLRRVTKRNLQEQRAKALKRNYETK